MNSKIIEVYKHYKSLYGSMVMLFRVCNNYEAYFDDAEIISTVLNKQVHTDSNENGVTKVILPASGILDAVGDLHAQNWKCKLISYRDNTGNFTLPDVKQLIKEQEMDY